MEDNVSEVAPPNSSYPTKVDLLVCAAKIVICAVSVVKILMNM